VWTESIRTDTQDEEIVYASPWGQDDFNGYWYIWSGDRIDEGDEIYFIFAADTTSEMELALAFRPLDDWHT
jgi:hypothetical protein